MSSGGGMGMSPGGGMGAGAAMGGMSGGGFSSGGGMGGMSSGGGMAMGGGAAIGGMAMGASSGGGMGMAMGGAAMGGGMAMGGGGGAGQANEADWQNAVDLKVSTQKVTVPCTRNTYKSYTVKVPRVVREKVPRTVKYVDMEKRTKTRYRNTMQNYRAPVTQRVTKMVSVKSKEP